MLFCQKWGYAMNIFVKYRLMTSVAWHKYLFTFLKLHLVIIDSFIHYSLHQIQHLPQNLCHCSFTCVSHWLLAYRLRRVCPMYKCHLVFHYAISLQTIHYFYQIGLAEIFLLHIFTKSLYELLPLASILDQKTFRRPFLPQLFCEFVKEQKKLCGMSGFFYCANEYTITHMTSI